MRKPSSESSGSVSQLKIISLKMISVENYMGAFPLRNFLKFGCSKVPFGAVRDLKVFLGIHHMSSEKNVASGLFRRCLFCDNV